MAKRRKVATERTALEYPTVQEIDDALAPLAAKSLAQFVRQAWPIVEPETELEWNWHHDAICEHLEAVTAGQIRNLLINVPPRHTKSRITSVMWPAWQWIRRAAHQWLCASYAAQLSTRDSVFCRQIIKSPWYQRYWGDRVKLSLDQNVKTKFTNRAGGHRIATSVGGAATGEGGDTIICDDPHNLQEIHSKPMREAAVTWWDQVMTSRLNDPKTSSRVVIMQRGHSKDLAGHILAKGNYDHLELQATADHPTVVCMPVSGKEVDNPEGALLWPDRFGREELDQLQQDLGSWAYAAQYQQRPVPEGGGIFKTEWWQYYDHLPEVIREVHSWDTAFKEKEENCYSVCIHIAECQEGYFLRNVWRGRPDYPTLKRMAIELYELDNPSAVLIEDKASGQSLIQDLRRTTMPVIAIKVDRDKVARGWAASPTVEAGRVFLPREAPWIPSFLEEMAAFNFGEFDDQVDAFTQVINWMVSRSRGKVRMHVPYDPIMAAQRW